MTGSGDNKLKVIDKINTRECEETWPVINFATCG